MKFLDATFNCPVCERLLRLADIRFPGKLALEDHLERLSLKYDGVVSRASSRLLHRAIRPRKIRTRRLDKHVDYVARLADIRMRCLSRKL